MKKFTSPKQKIGLAGERFAEMFLVKHGFTVVESNFSCRFGEIDIITNKNNRIHFIEVKSITVPRETEKTLLGSTKANVSHETEKNVAHKNVSRETFLKENRKPTNPFQNVSFFKKKRLLKTAEIYMNLKNVPRETRWQVDAVGVYLNEDETLGRIEYLENITIQ
jgi:Holliday junction resolvase-like predicted endonuclease